VPTSGWLGVPTWWQDREARYRPILDMSRVIHVHVDLCCIRLGAFARDAVEVGYIAEH
jgi:hypothetical protein